MKEDLIGRLSELTLEKRYLNRELNKSWYDEAKRREMFDKLMVVEEELNKVRFKIELGRKIKK